MYTRREKWILSATRDIFVNISLHDTAIAHAIVSGIKAREEM